MNLHALVDGNIVLNLDFIADRNVIGYIHILSQGTVRANHCAGLNMTEVPYFSALANADILIDITALMYIITHQSNLPLKSMVAHCSIGNFTIFPVAAD